MGRSFRDTKHTRHILRRYHFVRTAVENKRLTLAWIPTEFQLADLGTKILSGARTTFLTSIIMTIVPEKNIQDSKRSAQEEWRCTTRGRIPHTVCRPCVHALRMHTTHTSHVRTSTHLPSLSHPARTYSIMSYLPYGTERVGQYTHWLAYILFVLIFVPTYFISFVVLQLLLKDVNPSTPPWHLH